jgi:hypothetical protein
LAICSKRLRIVSSETNAPSEFVEPVSKKAQRRPRIEMSFVGKEQCFAESAGQLRFERTDGFLIQPLEAFRPSSESRQFRCIAAVSNDQTAALLGTWESLAPPLQTLFAESGNERLGTHAFAPWRQHASGIP